MQVVVVLIALLAFASAIPPRIIPRPILEPPEYKIDPSLSWRVVGGSDASPQQFPYIASLRNANGNHNCGGSIIASGWILTAAHCVVNANAALISVVVGSNTLNAGGTWQGVSRIIVNAGYNSNTVENDVAVLDLTADVQLGPGIAIIPLGAEVVGEVDAVLSGWGTTSLGGSIPNNLQFINLRTISQVQCTAVWGSNNIFSSSLCTLTQAGEGACHGDSGGPLTSNGVQIGTVSWGNPCANGIPDVFGRVSSFVPWIVDTLNS